MTVDDLKLIIGDMQIQIYKLKSDLTTANQFIEKLQAANKELSQEKEEE